MDRLRNAAQIYDTFCSGSFAEWAPRMADMAWLRPGQTVLDVACGTGLFAREALARVRPDGAVSGLDCNQDMLAVARQRNPALTGGAATPNRCLMTINTASISSPASLV